MFLVYIEPRLLIILYDLGCSIRKENMQYENFMKFEKLMRIFLPKINVCTSYIFRLSVSFVKNCYV